MEKSIDIRIYPAIKGAQIAAREWKGKDKDENELEDQTRDGRERRPDIYILFM